MDRYAITVRETLQNTVIVEANSLDDAIEKVEKAVLEGIINLDYDDYSGQEIIPSECFDNDGKVPDDKDVSFYCHLD